MKRMFAFLLTLCLVFSLLPVNMVAADPVTPPQQNHVDHHACTCAVTNGNACAGHGTDPAIQYQPWTDLTKLPTKGNWYLTGDVVATPGDKVQVKLEAGETLNLCLNGYSITFDPQNTAQANYYVNIGATLNITNCQAELDAKGLLVSDGTGRLQGGKAAWGGALYVKGVCNLYGVELYDNTCSAYGGAVRVQEGGVFTAVHSKIDKSVSNNCGGAISNYGENTATGKKGDATIVLDDTVISNSTGTPDAAIYLRRWQAQSTAATLIVKGDSILTGGKATGSGGAIYVASFEDTESDLNPKVYLQDNATIIGNTTGNANRGAVAVDQGTLYISGNVKITDNINTATGATQAFNLYKTSKGHVVINGQLGAELRIGIREDADPNAFLTLDPSVTLAETNYTGIYVEGKGEVGYTTAGGFAVQATSSLPEHKHYNGVCTIKGDTTCAHTGEAEVTYLPWYSATSLPTSGNYYLVQNVKLAAAGDLNIAENDTLNLCLNGHTIDFQVATGTTGGRYYAKAGATLNIINCQAQLNEKGQLVAGDKNQPANELAGRIMGGQGGQDHPYGATIYGAAGAVKLNFAGIEFYKNGRTTAYTNNTIYTMENNVANIVSCRFEANIGSAGSTIGSYNGGEINVVDTVFEDNKASLGGAIYFRSNYTGSQIPTMNISGNSAFIGNKITGTASGGGAIYVLTNAPEAANKKEVVLNVNGPVEFLNNDANGRFGGAILVKAGTVNVDGAIFKGNKAGYGGVIANETGNATITMNNITAEGNQALTPAGTAGNGGFAYLKVYKKASSTAAQTTTRDVVLTIGGNSVIKNNSAYSSGSAIYASRDTTASGAPANITCKVNLSGNTQITENYSTRTSGNANGAVSLDCSDAGTTNYATLSVADNVVIANNTNSTTTERANVFLSITGTNTGRMQVGAMGANADVQLYTNSTVGDPDDFMIANGVQTAPDIGITYVNNGMAVGYKPSKLFYFDTGLPEHIHFDCTCALGITGCNHGTEPEMEWDPWQNTNSLPTATGNYYLTGDVVLTNTAAINVLAGSNVKLCLNGYSIKFDENHKSHANYYVNTGSALTIMNCQAQVDGKGLLECGNKNAPTNEQAGRLFGGRGLYGGAIYVKGTLNLIGVEFYDNQANVTSSQANMKEGMGGALRVQETGTVNAYSSLFENNKALINGGAISVVQGNAQLNLHNTVFRNNEAIGVYKNASGTLSLTKETGFSVDEGKGRGGAICVSLSHATQRPACNLTEDVVVNLTGNTVFEDNITNADTGNQGGAIALITVAGNPNKKNLILNVTDDVQIRNNSSRGVAGAIYLTHADANSAPVINISGNAQIKGNQSTLSNAGAIYINNSAACTNSVQLNIFGKAVLEGNKTKYSGGAITAVQNSTKKGPVIRIYEEAQLIGNEAGSTGGAIYIQTANATGEPVMLFVTDKAQLTGNKAGTDGGAIAVSRNAEMYLMGNVQISGNEAKNRGGAIFVHRPAATPAGKGPVVSLDENVAIIGNKALTGNGGGVYIANDDFNKYNLYVDLSGNVQIKDNETTKNGPNLYLWGNTHVGEPLAQKLNVKGLTNKAEVYVGVNVGPGMTVLDPDEFMKLDDNYTLADTAKCGVIFETTADPIHVGYSAAEKFYFGGEMAEHDNHEVCLCAVTADPNCKHDTTMEWKPWIYADRLPTTTGNYYLTKNINITSNSGAGSIGVFEVKDGNKVNLCLNGFSIDFNEENTTKGNYYAMIGSELNIINCRAAVDKDNKFVTGNVANPEGGVIRGGRGMYGGAIYNKGTMNLIAIAFKDNKATHKTEGMGGAIRVQDGGKLTLQSCLFEGNEATTHGGAVAAGRAESTFIIRDTIMTKNVAGGFGGGLGIQDLKNTKRPVLTVTNSIFNENTAKNGGGVMVALTDATFENVQMNGNTATADGAGFYANASKVDFIKGVEIKNNTGKNSGGITLQAKAVLNMGDTNVVEGNSANNAGGIILWSESVLNMTGGEVRKNITKTGSGAGVWVQGGGVFNMSGGKISENNAASYGGGVYVTNSDARMSKFNMTGGEISDNSAANGTGVVFTKSEGTLTGGTVTRNISKQDGGGLFIRDKAVVTIGGDFVLSENFGKSGGGFVTQREGVLNITGGVIENNTANNGGGGILWSQSTVNMSGGIVRGNSVPQKGGAFYMQGMTTFNLSGGSITGNKATTYGGGIACLKTTKDTDGCTLNITGGEITKNESMGDINPKTGKLANGYGGGIYFKQGYINFNGGSISENKANYGGGVFYNTTKFVFTKGTVSKNYAKTNGGGMSSSQFSELIMETDEAVVCYNWTDGPAGGLLIQGRKTSTLDGKSVTKDYGTTLTMLAGKVYGNSAEKQGGGLYVSTESRAIIKGGSFTGNISVKETGGGLYESKGEILVYGGYFGYNSTFHAGGAIQASAGKLHVYGGYFEGNEAKYGAAIRTYNFTDTYIANATFVDNNVINHGGALALQSDSIVKNCTFKRNSALRAEGATNECDGGAIYVWGGSTYNRPSYEVTIEDCLFEENHAEILGGAVGVPLNCTLNLNSCIFRNNKSNDRGGAVASINSKNERSKPVYLNVNECEFVGNEAVNDGGAVYTSWTTVNTISGSTFTGNIAGRDGGAVYQRQQCRMFIDNCQMTDNTAGQRASAFFVGDNCEMENLTITGNKSGDGYALYVAEGDYDGMSYVRAIIKMQGDMIVTDNQGSKADMFIADKALVNIGYKGLGDKAKVNVELANGILTNTLLGEYNYEGGNLKYTVTKGNRSLTDPEPIPVEEPEIEATEPVTDPTEGTEPSGKQDGGIGIGGIVGISAALVVAVIGTLVGVSISKKKKADSAKDTAQK